MGLPFFQVTVELYSIYNCIVYTTEIICRTVIPTFIFPSQNSPRERTNNRSKFPKQSSLVETDLAEM